MVKQKCNGCRKMRYMVKYRQIIAPFGGGEPLTTMGKLCFWCGRKLKKIVKQMK